MKQVWYAMIWFGMVSAACLSTEWRGNTIEWLDNGHQYGSACVRIQNESQVIYFDPVNLSEAQLAVKADLILVTHPHSDHLSLETIAALSKPETQIVTNEETAYYFEGSGLSPLTIAVGETLQINGVEIQAVPAYNLASSAHPSTAGWTGYNIVVKGSTFYHSGDTSFIPEMAGLREIDVALMTLRDIYMMNGAEMVDAVKTIQPKLLIPIHWLEQEHEEIKTIWQELPCQTQLRLLEAI